MDNNAVRTEINNTYEIAYSLCDALTRISDMSNNVLDTAVERKTIMNIMDNIKQRYNSIATFNHKDLSFDPGYYEWLLTDKTNGEVVLAVDDSNIDGLWDEDENQKTMEEVDDICYQWLESDERMSEMLTEEEMQETAEMMSETLRNYYFD